jgi:hypothetical protein
MEPRGSVVSEPEAASKEAAEREVFAPRPLKEELAAVPEVAVAQPAARAML